MPDEQEMETIVNSRIDRDRIRDAILRVEIENIKKAVLNGENVAGMGKGESGEQSD